MSWISAHWQQIVQLMLNHLALALPAIIAGVFIAIAIARLATRLPHLGQPVVIAASLGYAIPALPLLIIIPMVLGTALRSPATMITALTIYAVALMVRSARDAFATIDPAVRHGALAVGYSPAALWWRVELPLALPVLIAGARVVTVSTVSLVTIGAVVGISSLGTLITDGFQRGIGASVAVGMLGTAALALVLDAALAALGKALSPWEAAR